MGREEQVDPHCSGSRPREQRLQTYWVYRNSYCELIGTRKTSSGAAMVANHNFPKLVRQDVQFRSGPTVQFSADLRPKRI